MCGKFTAQASWREVVDFSRPLIGDSGGGGGGGGGEGGDEGAPGETFTYRVGGQLPVIVWHAETKRRRVVPMRWAIPDKTSNAPVAAKALLKTVEGVTWQTFPEPKKPRAPRKPGNTVAMKAALAMRIANPDITLREIGEQLQTMQIPSPRGHPLWSASMVAQLLRA